MSDDFTPSLLGVPPAVRRPAEDGQILPCLIHEDKQNQDKSDDANIKKV